MLKSSRPPRVMNTSPRVLVQQCVDTLRMTILGASQRWFATGRAVARVSAWLISEDGMPGHRPHTEDISTRSRLCPTTLNNEPCTGVWLVSREASVTVAASIRLVSLYTSTTTQRDADRALCLSLPKASC